RKWSPPGGSCEGSGSDMGRESRTTQLRRLLEATGAAPGRWILTTVVASLVLAALDMVGVLAMLPLMQLITTGRADGSIIEPISTLANTTDVATLLPLVAALVMIAILVKSVGALIFRWWLLGRTTRI